MNGEFIQMIEDTRAELDSIRKWINAGNQFDSKKIGRASCRERV